MESRPKRELVRIAYYEGVMSLDLTGKAKGRGAYVCAESDCIEKAAKRNAFVRAFRDSIDPDDVARIGEELECLRNSKA